MSFYLTDYIVYPNNEVSEDYLTGVPGYLIYNQHTHADITYEEEFQNIKYPDKKLIKMTEKKYANEFFKNGSIRLGTLKYFRSFDDPEKGDKSEGSVVIVGQTTKKTAFARIGSGFDNYVFCCYDGEPNKKIIERFGYDDYFIISDPVGFADAISNKIGAQSTFFSKCIYKKDKVLVGKTPENFDFNVVSPRLDDLVGKTKHFIKTNNYKHQNEYRFMWKVNSYLSDKKDIKCPEAIQYCKRN